MSENEEIKELEEGEIIEFLDDNQKVLKFRFLDVTEYKGAKYVLLLPAEPDENFGENDVFIFRMSEDGTALEELEDENLLEEVFEYYQNESEETEEN